jgi:hypothetical protein
MATLLTQSVTIRANLGCQIVYSTAADRSDPVAMNDRTDDLTGNIYPFLEPSDDLAAVIWQLDGVSFNLTGTAPYDAVGDSVGDADPYDLLAVSPGGHVLSATIGRDDGQVETVTASFVVAHDPQPASTGGRAVVTTPQIDVTDDPSSPTPNVVAVAATIQTPNVVTGTINRAIAGIGVYPRLSGGPTEDDTNLEYLETDDYLGKKFGTQFSYIRQVLAKQGTGVFLGSADTMMNPAKGAIATLKNRSPNPIALQVWFPIQLEDQGFKANFAAKRTNFQRVADGDYDATIFQPFADKCLQYGWGTTSENLWLEIGGEQDAQGIQNPDAFSNGNVDVCVAAQIHLSRFFKQRLPRVKIGVTRIGNADDKYYNSSGSPTGLSSIQAWENQVVAQGNPSTDYDFCFQGLYFFTNSSNTFLQGRQDTIHALCQKYGWDFGAHEWGLSSPLAFSTGVGDRPDLIQQYYDWVVGRYPLWHHGCYFEGLAWSGMLPSSDAIRSYPGFPNSRKRFRKLFGDGIEA